MTWLLWLFWGSFTIIHILYFNHNSIFMYRHRVLSSWSYLNIYQVNCLRHVFHFKMLILVGLISFYLVIINSLHITISIRFIFSRRIRLSALAIYLSLFCLFSPYQVTVSCFSWINEYTTSTLPPRVWQSPRSFKTILCPTRTLPDSSLHRAQR